MRLAGRTWIPDDDEYFGPIFDGVDVFEGKNLETGLRYVKTWECAIDGGAHVGSWTRALAGRFKTVYAFEPQNDNFACLKANTAHLSNVELRHAALGNKFCLVGLTGGSNTGCWHVSDGGSCSMVALDEFRILRTLNVGYFKLDVEGYERFALEGARKLIARCSPVVQIEEKALPHSYEGGSARELLESWGYKQVDASGRDVIFTKG